MEPFFFGNRRLKFAIFHPSLSSTVRGAVIIAPPLLTESMRTHYALRRTAIGLAQAGFDILRFDFSGCGNSFGDLTQILVEDWIDDLCEATAELRDLTGQAHISVFSCRLSSGISAAVSSTSQWDSVIMWDPIFDGQLWLDQLRDIRSHWKNHHRAAQHEYMGELTSQAFTESLRRFRAPAVSARRVVSLVTDNSSESNANWERRMLSFDSEWRQPFVENLFAHSIVSESVSVLSE